MQLTRQSNKSAIPKLPGAAEKANYREKLDRDIEAFFANDGHITEIPMGVGAETKVNRSFSIAGSRGAEHMKQTRRASR